MANSRSKKRAKTLPGKDGSRQGEVAIKESSSGGEGQSSSPGYKALKTSPQSSAHASRSPSPSSTSSVLSFPSLLLSIVVILISVLAAVFLISESEDITTMRRQLVGAFATLTAWAQGTLAVPTEAALISGVTPSGLVSDAPSSSMDSDDSGSGEIYAPTVPSVYYGNTSFVGAPPGSAVLSDYAAPVVSPTSSDKHAGLGDITTTAEDAVFTVPKEADWGQPVIANINDPLAVSAQDVCTGYKAKNIKKTSTGLVADLVIIGDGCAVYGNDVELLSLTVEFQDEDRLHIEILPAEIKPKEESWYILPHEIVSKPVANVGFQAAIDDDTCCPNILQADNADLVFHWTNEPSFGFGVARKSTGDLLFDTRGSSLVFEDQFLELKSSMPVNYNIYGLPEVIHGFKIENNHTRTLYSVDAADPVDRNAYGVHPFYVDTRYFVENNDGSFEYAANGTDTEEEYVAYSHGIFFRNAHGHEIITEARDLTWRTIGGSIDLYFLAGPTQADVTRSYQKSVVGLPAMQQIWTLGFHQCRWGYTSWAQLQEVVDAFADAQIPLDTIWADIDYMNQYRNFENDLELWGYEDGKKFLDKLHQSGRHFVPIVDSAIYVPNPNEPSDAYATFERGVEADAFLMNKDGSLYIGAVWPGYTVFPDWPGGSLNGTGVFTWWADELARWHELVHFDGIWIDMSEVASFCVGSCGSGNETLNPVHVPFHLPGSPENEIRDYPEDWAETNATESASLQAKWDAEYLATRIEEPQPEDTESGATTTEKAEPTDDGKLRTRPTPGMRNINWPPYSINHLQGDLAVHAVSPNATSHGGYLQYDFHSLFGHQILNATYGALQGIEPEKRPYIIGRSTFAGSGKWAGHWGGDNFSKWTYMALSIPQMLTFQLAGIPMFGADACGFIGNAHATLCVRWMELAAFTPFYRNHNIRGAIGQEPYRWAGVAEGSRRAMKIRYSLLPYWYTLLHKAHAEGDTVIRAMAWEFPGEPWLAGADRQFLVGSNVLVTPVLEPGYLNVSGVFPGVWDDEEKGTVWYDWYTSTAVTGVERGQNVTIDSPLEHIPVYLRGGYVTPIQEPGMSVPETREGNWGLLVALDKLGFAKGDLYLDDGESLVVEEQLSVEFTAGMRTVVATPSGNFREAAPLGLVTVMGVEGPDVSTVMFNGEELPAEFWTFDSDARVLRVTGLDEKTGEGAWAESWSLSW